MPALRRAPRSGSSALSLTRAKNQHRELAQPIKTEKGGDKFLLIAVFSSLPCPSAGMERAIHEFSVTE